MLYQIWPSIPFVCDWQKPMEHQPQYTISSMDRLRTLLYVFHPLLPRIQCRKSMKARETCYHHHLHGVLTATAGSFAELFMAVTCFLLQVDDRLSLSLSLSLSLMGRTHRSFCPGETQANLVTMCVLCAHFDP